MIDNPLISELIFDSEFTSTDDIKRFNGMQTIRDESVSQHSYWVAVFSRFIAEGIVLPKYRKQADMIQFVLNCVTKSIFHDHDETVTGDVIFNFKHNNFNGKQVSGLVYDYALHNFKNHLNNKDNIVSEIVHESLFQLNVLEKSVIKVADWLACLKYEYQEIHIGNKNFCKILNKSLNNYKICIENLKEASVEYLGDKYNHKLINQLNLNYEQFIK